MDAQVFNDALAVRHVLEGADDSVNCTVLDSAEGAEHKRQRSERKKDLYVCGKLGRDGGDIICLIVVFFFVIFRQLNSEANVCIASGSGRIKDVITKSGHET